MINSRRFVCLLITAVLSFTAHAGVIDRTLPSISYVSFESADPVIETPIPFEKLTISGQFRVPVGCAGEDVQCPAVVIIHGSAGVDSRGMFYVKKFNRAGFATLEIDMWAPRGFSGGLSRPNTPPEIIATLADAYGALEFLSRQSSIDPNRIAIMGFSFGGILSMASATNPYTGLLTGGARKFAAHIAHSPICWVYNAIPGAEFIDFTGSPVLIQAGELDGYHSPETCPNLVQSLPDEAQEFISVKVYKNATHAWDRLQPRITVFDPFACFGQGCDVQFAPNPRAAFKSRNRAVRFLKKAFSSR